MVEKITNAKLKILSLFRTHYMAQYHVREMAKLLKISHATLIPHLKGLENDRILVSKAAGRNKVFSLEFENILTRNYIILS